MKYFTIDELCASATARARKIDNRPAPAARKALESLVDTTLDPLRQLWGKPLTVNSGYRSPALNKAVGGAKTSQHTRGEAADITTGSREGNRQLFQLLLGSPLPYDQVIDEKGFAWVHVSHTDARQNRREALRFDGKRYKRI